MEELRVCEVYGNDLEMHEGDLLVSIGVVYLPARFSEKCQEILNNDVALEEHRRAHSQREHDSSFYSDCLESS